MVKLLFSRRRHIGSYLIRAASWSEWSHVDVMLPNGVLAGAVFGDGVVAESLEHRLQLAQKAAIKTFPGNSSDATTFALLQVGKPYDTMGVLGIGLHREWDAEDKWWCSEFAAATLKAGGYCPFNSQAMRRITPQHLWMLESETEVVK